MRNEVVAMSATGLSKHRARIRMSASPEERTCSAWALTSAKCHNLTSRH